MNVTKKHKRMLRIHLFLLCLFMAQTSYSQFKHDNPNHSRLPCLLCHRRETSDPRPAMPGAAGHAPCAGCHAKEFANSGDKICTICHTDAQAATVKPFPRLSSFGMRFDHARHQNLGRLSCNTCHREPLNSALSTLPSALFGLWGGGKSE